LTIIYLGESLPIRSSDTEGRANNLIFPYRLAPNGVYRARLVAAAPVSSYLAFPPLPHKSSGLFLLHFP